MLSRRVPDKELLKTVNQRLGRSGVQSKVNVSVRSGTVTLSGKLQYDTQRMPLVKIARSVQGVRHVVDQLTTPPKTKPRPT